MINTDHLLERLHERITESGDGYNHGHCLNCGADITSADYKAGECTQCHSMIESDDEHLADD